MTKSSSRGLLKLPLQLIAPIQVRPDEPISQCLKTMREESTPAAIAVDDLGSFVGLFTERDYFLKGHLIERLMTKRSEIPVSACMDKTVTPVAAQDIHLAHNYMLRTGRRYLPIAASRDELKTVIGILSLDELVRFFIGNPINNSSSSLAGRRRVSLGLVSRDAKLIQQFETLGQSPEQMPRIQLKRIDLGDIVSDRQIRLVGESFDGIMLDVRSLQPKKWGKLAYTWFKSAQPKRIGVLSRLERIGEKVPKSLLVHIDENPVFHFFPRPTNTLEAAKTTLDFLQVF